MVRAWSLMGMGDGLWVYSVVVGWRYARCRCCSIYMLGGGGTFRVKIITNHYPPEERDVHYLDTENWRLVFEATT